MSLSTHVLDTGLGRPASGVNILLTDPSGDITAAVTDADGRARLSEDELRVGTYQLAFASAEYFASSGTTTFFPEVTISFTVTEADRGSHHHVPLLISPYAYSTYRGS